jgi:SAM-dependent methyltransferase
MQTDNLIEQNITYWNELFDRRGWGRYPPEELVRFVARTYSDVERRRGLYALEVGCGPGPNLWYLAREGFTVAGIDGSANAIALTRERLRTEGLTSALDVADLRVGNFVSLPWKNCSFDVVIDIEAVVHNTTPVIRSVMAEIIRVLKPGGWFFAKMFSTETTGIMSGTVVEDGTFASPRFGPIACALVHPFTEDEVCELLSSFQDVELDRLHRSDGNGRYHISEWIVRGKKISNA